MKPTPTIPPPGFEILTPDTLRTYGAVKDMQLCEEGIWEAVDYVPIGFKALNFEYAYAAPTGTTALLSTPLPEPECIGCYKTGPLGLVHEQSCPAHPNNRLVKVLPGWLEKCKEKPKGLMFACSAEWCKERGIKHEWIQAHSQWGAQFRDPNNGDFAYAVPIATYDAIEAERKAGKIDKLIDDILATPNMPEPSPAAATPTDSELLDWLEKNDCAIHRPNFEEGDTEFIVYFGPSAASDGRGPTLRAAIQNAMEGGK